VTAPAGFELLLFATNPAVVRAAVAGGVDGIIVDWERRGKVERQACADTQINHDTLDDLRRVCAATTARVICRINGVGETTDAEVETAIAAGADEILVPMVRAPREVQHVLDVAGGRAGVGMLVETVDAVAAAAAFAVLPLTRVYVGLNDLSIERGSANLFAAVTDGTVERLRRTFDVPFGFGGLTLPERGHPIPCRLLIGEMTRLGCGFSFLRRSFWRDARGMPMEQAVSRIRHGLAVAAVRAAAACEDDRQALCRAVAEWELARVAQ
jgi:HpcH/HpaI aldolase/citrate lyase family